MNGAKADVAVREVSHLERDSAWHDEATWGQQDKKLNALASPGVGFCNNLRNSYCRDSALKRGVDILGALVGLIVLSPVFAVTAIAIKLTSPGPVIFRQTRLGMDGVPFEFFKFRSMHHGVDDRIHREYISKLILRKHEEHDQSRSSKAKYKMVADNRITPVGRVIRRWSIDELPQLVNVLRGEMSLVGPRPPLLYEVEMYNEWHLSRLCVAKPGLTGVWQVEGRSATTFDDMIRLDLRYARECSLFCDLKIILKTVPAVIRGKGAV